MMLFGAGLKVPSLPDGSSAIWNRRVEIVEAMTVADVQDQVNAFLEDLGVNPDFELGAAVLGIRWGILAPDDLAVLIDYGFYSPV
jgi:hypothetical protein